MFATLTRHRFGATILGLLCTVPAQAAVIFNNFGPGDTFQATGRIVQGPAVGTIGDVDQAASFMTGANPTFLTSISLGMGVSGPPNVGTGPLDVILAADAGGVPGSDPANATHQHKRLGDQVVTVVDDGSQMLDPNTQYWVIADGEGEFDGAWRFNSIGDIGDTAGRSDGFPWNLRPMDDHYALRVEGRVVPEPAAAGLLMLGISGVLLRLRRRTD